MKSILKIIIPGLICACTASRKAVREYYYVQPFKEQEVKLILGNDSIFMLQDLTGCNQFDFIGKYKRVSDSVLNYIIFDSIKLKSRTFSSDSGLIFSIKSGDTAWVVNRERIFIHNEPFKLTTKSNINLQEIRYKELEDYYVNLLGLEGFIKVFGDGKGKKEARRRLLECKIPDINIKKMKE